MGEDDGKGDQTERAHGRPVSGRLWKSVEKQRASVLRNVKAKQTSWDAREVKRRELQLIRERQEELLATRKARLAEIKAKREAKKARKQRNEFKNASYQVINNEMTIKSLSKKQLRMIKRTRVSKEGEVELVDAYAPTYDPKAKRQRRRR
ncbi:hypothetical protein CTAYLR_007853 [Chrysophaeum taylorii]|uniref:Coiled-coil domain-containing protein 86 n=1 Tax=Chrysophaeum taylorii TaxID=2483200 RepID=A0AAD7UER6_9STRA|nr:hypothetical protein CTAYLR_007853 [Chrysophaeum taylorii]